MTLILCIMVKPINTLLCTNDKKLVLHPMSPEAILKDELARASKLKNQEHAKSKNQIVANELEKHKKGNNKSGHDNQNAIKLKASCFIATKTDMEEIDSRTTICYALVCKDTLFSLEEMPSTLPPAVTKYFAGIQRCFSKGATTRAATNPRDRAPD
jgi:hypothetical protein